MEEFSITALSDITAMISTDVNIVNSVVNKVVVDVGVIDVKSAIFDTQENLNIYAKSIFDFIVNSELQISDAEKFEIVSFLSTFDFATITG